MDARVGVKSADSDCETLLSDDDGPNTDPDECIHSDSPMSYSVLPDSVQFYLSSRRQVVMDVIGSDSDGSLALSLPVFAHNDED